MVGFQDILCVVDYNNIIMYSLLHVLVQECIVYSSLQTWLAVSIHWTGILDSPLTSNSVHES